MSQIDDAWEAQLSKRALCCCERFSGLLLSWRSEMHRRRLAAVAFEVSVWACGWACGVVDDRNAAESLPGDRRLEPHAAMGSSNCARAFVCVGARLPWQLAIARAVSSTASAVSVTAL